MLDIILFPSYLLSLSSHSTQANSNWWFPSANKNPIYSRLWWWKTYRL